jgi:hypothetical protein
MNLPTRGAAAVPASPQPLLDVRSTLDECGALHLWISGWSMAPLLLPGDRIEVRPCRAEDLRPGDLALLEGPSPVVHRYLFREGEGLVAKGDGAPSTDPPWPPAKVLGRAVKRLRGARPLPLDRGWPLWKGRAIAWTRAAVRRMRRRA